VGVYADSCRGGGVFEGASSLRFVFQLTGLIGNAIQYTASKSISGILFFARRPEKNHEHPDRATFLEGKQSSPLGTQAEAMGFSVEIF
jgi:hypothetical protein